MADFVMNYAKGRLAELAYAILGTGGTAQQANGVFVIVLLASSGVESDATLKDKATLASLVSGATDEATNTGYSRLIVDETGDGLSVTIDTTNDRVDVDMNDPSWAAVTNDGTGAISDLVVCYDPDSTGGTDAAIVPLVQLDFSVTPNGGSITATLASGGFYRAS